MLCKISNFRRLTRFYRQPARLFSRNVIIASVAARHALRSSDPVTQLDANDSLCRVARRTKQIGNEINFSAQRRAASPFRSAPPRTVKLQSRQKHAKPGRNTWGRLDEIYLRLQTWFLLVKEPRITWRV